MIPVLKIKMRVTRNGLHITPYTVAPINYHSNTIVSHPVTILPISNILSRIKTNLLNNIVHLLLVREHSNFFNALNVDMNNTFNIIYLYTVYLNALIFN